jgi:uncharacterized SAM-binding protein YcdF (DUF218 family)
MFLYLSKLLPLLVYPVGLAVVLLLVGWWSRSHARPRLLNLTLLGALLLLGLGGNRCVAYTLLRTLEWRYLPPADMPQVGAIVVLGGGTRQASYPRPLVEVNEAGDRLLYAAQLYQQKTAEHILLSGGTIEWLSLDDTRPEADDMAAVMELLGVPTEALWLEPESRNTYENALYSRAILEEAGIHHILLVTSALHMPRAVPLFEQQGLHVTPAPTDYIVSERDWHYLWQAGLAGQLMNLLPSAENLEYTTRVLKEYLGLLVYGLRGWL